MIDTAIEILSNIVVIVSLVIIAILTLQITGFIPDDWPGGGL